MKAIMLSVKPEWVKKILDGEKTIEIRKVFPSDYVGWVYIYCTKAKSELYSTDKGYVLTDFGIGSYYKNITLLNGKVVARFWCDRVQVNHVLPSERILPFNGNVEPLLDKLCLTKYEVMDYGRGQDYYARLIFITKLKVFGKPKELSEFALYGKSRWDVEAIKKQMGLADMDMSDYGLTLIAEANKDSYSNCKIHKYLKKAPQNYCYVEVDDDK